MRKFRFLASALSLVLVLAACSPGADPGSSGADPGSSGGTGADVEEGDGSIVVTSLWGGTEQEAFEAVLAAFTEETGIEAQYEANRTDYATVLRTRIQGGEPPDVAIIPGIGTLRSLAREGSLIPLSELGVAQADIEGNYAPGILDVGVVDDELYGIMVKLNSKATIWYSPERFEEMGVEPAEDWDGLLQLTEDIKAAGATPWSLGAADGWTLTDWFEIMYLKMHGTDAYDTLFSPDGDWTDDTVQATIDKMLEILSDENVDGGVDGASATAFVDAIGKVFSTSPSAELYYGGGFVGGIATGDDVNPDLAGQEGTAIDWFPFPTIDGNGEGLVTYGGDVMAALVADSDVAAFMEYLTTAEAGQVWAEGGTIISPIVDVDTSVYPTSLIQAEAEQVTSAEAVRFDGSDLLPGVDLGALLQSAFRGEDMAPLLEEFQTQVSTAWETE
ncbi:MAG: carbohydrate ABC transporter substrate-binding protein [Chloroflexi bacterium]|nr:carbohydrate ABC transporter substrate-binding protein [Chloroflexota bacterium]